MKLLPGFFSVIAMLLTLGGCDLTASSPIDYGRDQCHSCLMGITEKEFGGEVVLKKGKVYKFDSLECMAPFLAQNHDNIGRIFVADSLHAGALLPVENAVFLIDRERRSPMGEGIVASSSRDLAALRKLIRHGGDGAKLYRWGEVLARIQGRAAWH